MVCTPIPGGFACGSRKPLPRCGTCSGRAPLLCDWKVEGGTCDAKICHGCATLVGPEKHLCPHHAQAWEAWKADRARG